VYSVYITNQFQAIFVGGGGGGVVSISRSDCEQQGGKSLDGVKLRMKYLGSEVRRGTRVSPLPIN
jgi:hypothetical protein